MKIWIIYQVSALRARLFRKKPELFQNAVQDGFLADVPQQDIEKLILDTEKLEDKVRANGSH